MKDKKHDMIRDLGFSLLDEGKILRIRADGYSMFPSVRAGNYVYVEPVDNPVPGEIIAWKRDTGFVVHRLIRVEKRGNMVYYVTRGDSCLYEDIEVKKEQIAGRVVRIETHSGRSVSDKKKLIGKFNYIYNRFLVWTTVKLKRITGRMTR